MSRHLPYNPGRDSVDYLQAITCGARGQHILEQLLISLRGEIGRANHQHHLLIGPRGAGKTHLLRLLTAGRIPADTQLATAYLPVVMPEETALRSPADLFLKFVERLAELLKVSPAAIAHDKAANARAICLAALTSAKGMRNPLDRLESAANALTSAAQTLERILLVVAENMDQILYLGAQTTRKGPQEELWALRRHLQASPHLLLIAAAPTLFGAVGSPGQAFFDFFREHQLSVLADAEVLEVIRRRLDDEAAHPGEDALRQERVRLLKQSFPRKSQDLSGILAITGGLPRFVHLIYEVLVQTDLQQLVDVLDDFLDEMTPYFQTRIDPRLVPQPEIDLLHTLALARSPKQPTELAALLYGVGTNEVSELLGRLQERGLVQRVGRPGGKAVTWDLTEPLFRVWTQFRDNPDALQHYQLLAEIVAVIYTLNEIEADMHQLAQEHVALPAGCRQAQGVRQRLNMLESAKEAHQRFESVAQNKSFDPAIELSATRTRSDRASTGTADRSLEELRSLSLAHPEAASLREALANGLVNERNGAAKAGDHERSQALLEELRGLSLTHPDEASLREELATGLFNAFYDAGEAGDNGRTQALLEELRSLSLAHTDEASLRELLSKGLLGALFGAGEVGDTGRAQTLLLNLMDCASRFSSPQAAREIVLPAAMIFGRLLLAEMQVGPIDAPRESFRAVQARTPLDLADLLHPIALAMDVITAGEEQALAREPEEVRRVVRTLLSSVQEKMARDAGRSTPGIP